MSRRTVLGGKFVVTPSEKEDEPAVAKCIYCDTTFKYHHSTSSLKYHLKHKHPFLSISSSTTSSSSAMASDASSSVSKTTNASSTSSADKVKGSDAQPKLLSYLNRTTTAQHELNIFKALVLWIARNLRPITIVQDEGLVDLLRVATGNPDYQPPGRKQVKTKLLDLYRSKAAEIQEVLTNICQEYPNTKLTLAVDYWTSGSANDSYVAVVIFLVDLDWKYRQFTIGIHIIKDNHTAENIKLQILSLLEEWNISTAKVSHICSDNAANMRKAIQLLGKAHMPCMAHTLQLSIRYALEKANVSNTLAKCRKIVGHFKHSAIQESRLDANIRAASTKSTVQGLVSL